jgi:hypothetical protein
MFRDAYYNCRTYDNGIFVGVNYGEDEPSMCDRAAHQQQVQQCRPYSEKCIAQLNGLSGGSRQQLMCGGGICAEFWRCAETSLLMNRCTGVQKYTKTTKLFRDQCSKDGTAGVGYGAGMHMQCEANKVAAVTEASFCADV